MLYDIGDHSEDALAPCWTGLDIATCSPPSTQPPAPNPQSLRPPSPSSTPLPLCHGSSLDLLEWIGPICGLILLRRRAVNTHFCGCQFGEGRQPCGTQRSITSIPSSGNRAGWETVRATLFLSLLFPPREPCYCS